jgi:hypothetical protein
MISGEVGVVLGWRRSAKVVPCGVLGDGLPIAAGQVLLVMVGVGLAGMRSPGVSMGCGLDCPWTPQLVRRTRHAAAVAVRALLMSRFPWYFDDEARAAAWPVGHPDSAAVPTNVLGSQRESEADPGAAFG